MIPKTALLPVTTVAGPFPAVNCKILVVGDVARWKNLGMLCDNLADCAFVDMDDLDGQNIKQIAPDLVISALVTTGFDAVDVAKRLHAVKFAGRYCAVANDVPDTDIIRSEIRSVAPKLAFDLLVLPLKPNAGAGSG